MDPAIWLFIMLPMAALAMAMRSACSCLILLALPFRGTGLLMLLLILVWLSVLAVTDPSIGLLVAVTLVGMDLPTNALALVKGKGIKLDALPKAVEANAGCSALFEANIDPLSPAPFALRLASKLANCSFCPG